jgi:hypothetical protein
MFSQKGHCGAAAVNHASIIHVEQTARARNRGLLSLAVNVNAGIVDPGVKPVEFLRPRNPPSAGSQNRSHRDEVFRFAAMVSDARGYFFQGTFVPAVENHLCPLPGGKLGGFHADAARCVGNDDDLFI